MPATATKLTRRAKRVAGTFGSGRPGSRGQVATLRKVITRSPHLKAQLNEAVASGRLTRFEEMPPGTNAGGEYWPSTGAIRLPPIATPVASSELAFTLGHEVQHALNSSTVDLAVRDLYFDSHAAAQSSHDYTDAIARVVQAHRNDEAIANLAGWNAMIDNWCSAHPVTSLDDVYDAVPYRASDFVERGLDDSIGPRANIKLNADQTVDLSSRNIKGMGQNFFDNSADQTAIGHHGDSDYINYYTALAISQAAPIHAAVNPGVNGQPGPPMLIDMARLRASRQTMERNGISLGDGSVEPPVPYVDVSTTPPSPGYFHHTVSTHQYIPIKAAAVQDHADGTTAVSPERLAQASFARRPRQAAQSAVDQKELAAAGGLGAPRGPTIPAGRTAQCGSNARHPSRGSE